MEMNNTYVHFGKLYTIVSEMIETLERRTLYEAGLYSLSIQFLGRLQAHLSKMYYAFHPHINIPPPPELKPDLFLTPGDEETQDEEREVEPIEDDDSVEDEDGEERELYLSESIEIVYD